MPSVLSNDELIVALQELVPKLRFLVARSAQSLDAR